MAASGGGPEAPHRPVLLIETVRLLAPNRGGLFVDATLGLGGHSEAILEASAETRVLGIDRDREALRLAAERLAHFGTRFRLVHANFRDIERVIREAGEQKASGVAPFVTQIMPMVAAGRIRPLIDRVFAFDELPAAREHMESNRHLGKIVIAMP